MFDQDKLDNDVFVIGKCDILKYGTVEAEVIASLLECYASQNNSNMTLSELGNIYGDRTYFYNVLLNQTYFLERTVEKLEKMIYNDLTGENFAKGLDCIINYRRVKKYVIFEEALNKSEIILIRSLRTIFEQQTNQELSLSELGTIFENRKLFSDAWRRRVIFKSVSIDMFENKVNQLLKDDLLINALNALDSYREARCYKKLETLLEDPNYSNYIPELELILILKQNFSEEFGQNMSLGNLGVLLKENRQFFYHAIELQNSFRDLTLSNFRAKIDEYLTGSNRKETLRILIDYEQLDKLRKRESELGLNRWDDPEYRLRQELTRKSEKYLEKMRGSASPRWITDRSQVDSRGYTKRFRYLRDFQKEYLLNQQLGLDGLMGKSFTEYDVLHRHHIDYNKSNDDLNNLILLISNMHSTIPISTNQNALYYHKILSENKQDFIAGIAPRNWSEEAKKIFYDRQANKRDLRDFS